MRRRAAEALVRMGQSPDKPSLAPVADIYALLNDPDRFVRWAGRIALEQTARAEWKDRVLDGNQPARRARRHARLGPDRERREPAAGRSTSSSRC